MIVRNLFLWTSPSFQNKDYVICDCEHADTRNCFKNLDLADFFLEVNLEVLLTNPDYPQAEDGVRASC